MRSRRRQYLCPKHRCRATKRAIIGMSANRKPIRFHRRGDIGPRFSRRRISTGLALGQVAEMPSNGAGLRDPDILARLENMLDSAPEGTQAKWLANDERVHHHTHYQRLIVVGLPHLVELIDHHVGEIYGIDLTADDGRAVVQLLRI